MNGERKARNRKKCKELLLEKAKTSVDNRQLTCDKAIGSSGRKTHSVSSSAISSSKSLRSSKRDKYHISNAVLKIDDVSDELFSSPTSSIHSFSYANSLPRSRCATPPLRPEVIMVLL